VGACPALREQAHNTIHAYIQAVRLLGEWTHQQNPSVQPTDVTSRHVQASMADLIERTSAGNAHTNYRGLRTFWKWMVLEEEVEHSPMRPT
jgi:site-specific recombinase XerD